MSLVSSIPKIWNTTRGYATRIAKVAPEAILGTGSEVAGAAMRSTKGSLLTKAKAGFKAVEKTAAKGSFLSRLGKNLNPINLFKSLKSSTAAGARIAAKAGKSKIWGGIKGLTKGLGKKMPFIGAALMVACEIPNIWSATKEQGIGAGIKETVKATGRLAGGAAGAAIGSAICPGIGTLVGWVAGEWLTSKVVGKTYTEKKYEAEEQMLAEYEAQQAAQAQQPTFTGAPDPYNYNPNNYNPYNFNPYGYNGFGTNPYSNDIMMQQMNFLA